MAGSQRIAQSGEHRVLGVPRGLHILRYVHSGAAQPPVILITPSVNAGVDIISADPRQSPMLSQPGDALVLRGLSPQASINLHVQPATVMGSRDAELRLEPLLATAGPVAPARVQSPDLTTQGSRPWSVQALSVMAHVSRRGDVTAGLDEWICGPDLPMVIEGLQIDWPDAPRGLVLRCTVESAMRPGIRSFSGGFGEFVGSRRKAAPLIKIAMALEGPDAAGAMLSLDALFLGSAVQSRTGQAVQFRGPSGREPLVGLRVGLIRNERRLAPISPVSTSRHPHRGSLKLQPLPPGSGSSGRYAKIRRSPMD